MKQIKDVCEKCNHVTNYTWKDYVKRFFVSTMLFMGVFFTIMLIVLGPAFVLNMSLSKLMLNSIQDDLPDLRQLALNYTTFDGYDSFKYAEDLVKNMPRIRYALPSKFVAMGDWKDTWNYAGDCKQSATLFAGMMLASGYYAEVDCNFEKRHCVTKIPEARFGKDFVSDEYMIVDLSGNFIAIYDEGVDWWNHVQNYNYYHIYNNKVKS